MIKTVVISLLVFLLGTESLAEARNSGAELPAIHFELVRENPSLNGERRQVLRFEADGLRQYALLLWPAGDAPASGWPVLLFNHGYHPNPPEYGRNARGESDRPGDYYRAMAQAYVDRGMVVLVPDYRGHNDSEGKAVALDGGETLPYSRDAVAAFRGLDSLPGLDASRRFVVGHSMGGLVTLAALQELQGQVAAASIWSSMAWPGHDPALPETDAPLLVQHARGDATTTVQGSVDIAEAFKARGDRVELQLYDSDDHLFTGDQFLEAVERDLAWFTRSAN